MNTIPGRSYKVEKADGTLITYKFLGGAETKVEILESTSVEFRVGQVVLYAVLYSGGFLDESEV